MLKMLVSAESQTGQFAVIVGTAGNFWMDLGVAGMVDYTTSLQFCSRVEGLLTAFDFDVDDTLLRCAQVFCICSRPVRDRKILGFLFLVSFRGSSCAVFLCLDEAAHSGADSPFPWPKLITLH